MAVILKVAPQSGVKHLSRIYFDQKSNHADQGACGIEIRVDPFPVEGLAMITLFGSGVVHGAPGVNAGVTASVERSGTVISADTDFSPLSHSVSYLANCATNVFLAEGEAFRATAKVKPYGDGAASHVHDLNAIATLVFLPNA